MGPTAFVVIGAVVAAIVVTVVAVIAIVANDRNGPGPGPSPTPVVSGATMDDQVRAGVDAIARGAEQFAGSQGYGPAVDDALPTGLLAQYVDPWPTNPYTGEPMTQGTGAGDFTFYTATSMGDGQEYLGYVQATLSTGEVYSSPFQY